MAGYTMVNLKEVEDQAPKFGMSPGIESRFARVPLELRNSGMSYFRLSPDFRIPFGHRHEHQEEVYVLVAGSARMRIGEDEVELSPWDAVRVEPETIRGLQAGPEGAEVLVFGAPTRRTATPFLCRDGGRTEAEGSLVECPCASYKRRSRPWRASMV